MWSVCLIQPVLQPRLADPALRWVQNSQQEFFSQLEGLKQNWTSRKQISFWKKGGEQRKCAEYKHETWCQTGSQESLRNIWITTTLMRQHQQEKDKDKKNKQLQTKIATNYLFCTDKQLCRFDHLWIIHKEEANNTF